MHTKPRILCVDDEPNVLDSFRRLLRKDFDLNTANSGADGIQLVEQNGPYAVVVSDFKMPGMDGVEFLSKVRKLAPDTVRVMLTGQAEEKTAAKAINDGRIFRFLYKPISSSEFLKCLQDGIRHYNLVTSEKELLEKTLKGSIEVMTEILSLTNPLAFSRAIKVQQHCQHLGKNLGLENSWQLEVAAMLSHLGYITIPSATLEKRIRGHKLSEAEFQMFDDLPAVTQNLIGHIPRLETILKIIKLALGGGVLSTVSMTDEIAISASILRTIIEFEDLLERGHGLNEALNILREQKDHHNLTIVNQLKILRRDLAGTQSRRMSIDQIRVGMILKEPIHTPDGLTVTPAGFRVNDLIRQLLKNLKLQGAIPEIVEVTIEDVED